MNKMIILFDGVCNFCNFWVNFIMDRDKDDRFRFCSLQSEKGQEYLRKFNLQTENFDTFILITGESYLMKSAAGFRVLRSLKTGLRVLLIFSVLPTFITDGIYSLIAKNRYSLFGKKESCRIPTPEERSKFIG
ncbi:MAG: thiol-disulfide oxidoreductase DCC family protein [Ignavibacteriaceae bacterium]|nr:thiol-disulfide oxidoreductase DCC family protein [Ignavibacteriaceae bacterium]NUM69857.1 thiol-disulfide oxidoreductase DCC family protein [Ignavibacteriaceae bacterium]